MPQISAFFNFSQLFAPTFYRVSQKQPVNMDDVIKAMRRGNREGEQEVLGPGFHATNRVHRSKKTYTRKAKHKGSVE